jgi:tetratricopeptide (TPR) repeat protein
MQNTRKFSLTPLVACLCAGFAISAQAQILDEVEWRQDGADAILTVEFFTPVQYTKSISARASDLVQVFYNVLPTREEINLSSTEQRLPGSGGLPSVIVRDESAATIGKTSVDRKLVISFSTPTRFTVRPGRLSNDRSSIELVLAGMGNSVQAASVKTTKILPLASAATTSAASSVPTTQAGIDNEVSASALMATAQSAFDGGQYDAATESLNKLLNLPPNNSSRKAQELAGLARLNAGDKTRAASEFGVFLKLYPEGADSDRIKQILASLPAPGTVAERQDKPAAVAVAVTSGSISSFYYGGQSDNRTLTQDYVDNGIPVPRSETTLSNVDQKQVQTNVDLNWRLRDDEKDVRFVFRDAYTDDLLKSSKSKERLTALYVDYKSLALGGNIRVGRQSPSGGGVLYRFDGVQAGYIFQPKWKVNAVIGKPSDDLLDTKRSFYGVSVDAEALTKELSGSAYLVEQTVDGETDRRALGADLRYFKGGLSASGQLDYDQILSTVNVAAFQSTWQVTEGTMLNVMLDRRTTPILSLGNSLFLNLITPQAQRIQDLLGGGFSVDSLRETITTLKAYQNQFRIGGTTTITPTWQTGADFSVSSTDATPALPSLNIQAQPASGNRWGVSAQLIGTNLYSARDTHVFNLSLMGGPSDHGTLLSYNNLSSLSDKWQLEPSLKYYTQTSAISGDSDTWTAGIRGIYRVRKQISLETELTYEKQTGMGATSISGTGALVPGTAASATRMNYYLGARYEF